MLERRKADRYSKRCPVKFGINKPLLSAFTEDISAHGIFLRTTVVAPVGTRIVIELTLPKNEKVLIAGSVIRVEKTNSQMNMVKNTGIGIEISCFKAGAETYRQFIAELNSYDVEQAHIYCAA